MTIPSRPAPPPPQQQATSQQHSATSSNIIPIKLPPPPAPGSIQRTYSSKLPSRTSPGLNALSGGSSVTRHFPAARYAPATNWDGFPFDQPNTNNPSVKKIPPPRPPPPRISPNMTGNTVLKKPGPPQSINVLSNLFGRKKGHTKNNKQQLQQQSSFNQLKLNSLPNVPQNNTDNNRLISSQPPQQTRLDSTDVELIKFDSPPSSPTFTQKSNSDCVSVDSFSSDSNFSSPQNGSVSQPESGFEDDFLSPTDPWAINSINNGSSSTTSASRNYGFLTDKAMLQPVRNLNAINRSQNDNPLCNGKSLLPPQETLTMPTIIKPKPSLSSSSNTSSPVHTGSNTLMLKSQTPSMLQLKNANDPSACFSTYSDGESSPPMPSCPPPPPPSSDIFDVIAGRLDAINLSNRESEDDSQSYGIALYDFEGVEDGDLSFKENEKIYVLQRVNEEWCYGRNKQGCEGIFPSNYIEIKVPLKDDSAGSNAMSKNNISSKPISNSHPKVRVLYNFNAEVPEDLSLKENDMVTVLSRINDDWLFGELRNQRGQFPANFLEYIPQDLPIKMP